MDPAESSEVSGPMIGSAEGNAAVVVGGTLFVRQVVIFGDTQPDTESLFSYARKDAWWCLDRIIEHFVKNSKDSSMPKPSKGTG